MSNVETITNVQMTKKAGLSPLDLRHSSLVIRHFFHAPRTGCGAAGLLA
jgi:hypothetical protein